MAELWWIMLVGSVVVFGVVVMLIAIGVLERRAAPSTDDRRARGLVLVGGIAAPIVVLSALFALVLRTLPATSAPQAGRTRLTVEVVGKQWFWEARYPGADAVTANEIHIPARTSVLLRVRTADVIHSFWLPRLNRKIDLIPGKLNEIELRADEPGVYRGQCAEFCGLQHANMAFLVYADRPEAFRRWLARQAAPRAAPSTPAQNHGERVFLEKACAGCHTIRGTPADGQLGPDLTHLASRSTLASVTIPNTKGDLAAWVLDPQHVKPGNKMPGIDLSGRDLDALLAYLESLE
jgi:cytochrome c oxidase subunit II